MLGALDTLQFRHQNDPHKYNTSSSNSNSNNVFKNAKFLPANYYPVQTPGYSVQWTKERVEIIERIGETAKIVHELSLSELTRQDCSQIFNPIPRHERPRKSVKSGGFLFQNWTGWIYKKFTSAADQKGKADSLKIIDVIPLIFDETVFDSVVVIKNGDMVGFIRIRLLITGNLKSIQQFNDFIPALPIKSDNLANLITWKHLIFAFDGVAIKFINLNDAIERSEWKTLLDTTSPIEDICVCEDKTSENRIILLLKSPTNIYEIFKIDLINLEAELINRTIAAEPFQVCGYIENDNLYVIQGQNLYEISLETADLSVFLLHDNFQFINSKLYLFPWRQDLKVSALLFYLTHSADNSYMISIMSVIGTKSEIILESDWFENDSKIVSMFATSSLELFLLDECGNVQIYSGLLLKTDWQWKTKNHKVTFEFTHWFNILGEFPFKPVEYYNSRRLQVNDTLFIDDLMKFGIEFPPTNWKSLGHACRQLKDENIELILYHLFASGAGALKLQSFYNQFGMKDRQVSAIELAFACDHGDYGRASNLFCTRKIEEGFLSKFIGKIVKFMKKSESEELTKFSLFSAGRIVSIDLLLEDESLMNGMLESILKFRDIPTALEWIKGLFAWLRPDDRCALIPVAILHQTFMKRLLAIVLKCEDNAEFKRLGNEFVDAPFDPEMLRTILTFLSDDLNDSCGDRSAWLITMICAIRGRLHGYFLEFDFGAVKDEEVLKGIENIRRVIRSSSSNGSVKLNEGVYEGDYRNRNGNENVSFNNNISYTPLAPLTPLAQSSMSPSHKNEFPMKTASPSQSKSQSPSQSKSPLLSVYARTPSSPKSSPVRLTEKTGTFTPRHYPTKKPSTLKIERDERDEDDDPFKEDMRMINGKRSRHEEESYCDISDISDTSVVILTKDEQVKSFESVINIVVNEKKKRPKLKRSVNRI